VRATADLALARLTVGAGVGRAREHLVLGGHPAGALALEPAGDAFGEGRGAQHSGASELDEHAAFGVVEPVAGDAHLAKVLGSAPVMSGLL